MHIFSRDYAVSITPILILAVFHCALTEVHSLQFAATIDPCSTDDIQQGQHWANDLIPYALSDNLSRNTTIAIQQSMYEIEMKTSLRYLPRTNENDYFLIQQNLHCCAHKGKVGIGIHYINIHESCAVDKGQLNNVIASAGLVDRELEPSTDERGCGASMYIDHTSQGSLSTPGYPSEYTSSTVCLWKFWISTGTILELEIVNFELEYEVDCSYDHLQIIKQSALSETESTAKHCGTSLNNQKFNFTAGTLSLKFLSDMDLENKGFLIKYTAYSDTSSHTLCTEYNGGCEHQCISDENKIKQKCACNNGYVLSSDGRTCEDINECLVNKGGCNQRCRNTIGSYYCQCSPQYGISQDEKHTCKVCGGEFDDIVGGFTSPGYPSEFSNLQNCQWTINLRPNHILRIAISNLSIPSSNRCINNYFKPQHGHFNYKKRICGNFNHIQYSINPPGDSTYFRFRTELFKFFNHTGFHLTYEQVPITQTTQLELDTVYVNKIEIPYETNNWLS